MSKDLFNLPGVVKIIHAAFPLQKEAPAYFETVLPHVLLSGYAGRVGAAEAGVWVARKEPVCWLDSPGGNTLGFAFLCTALQIQDVGHQNKNVKKTVLETLGFFT